MLGVGGGVFLATRSSIATAAQPLVPLGELGGRQPWLWGSCGRAHLVVLGGGVECRSIHGLLCHGADGGGSPRGPTPGAPWYMKIGFTPVLYLLTSYLDNVTLLVKLVFFVP